MPGYIWVWMSGFVAYIWKMIDIFKILGGKNLDLCCRYFPGLEKGLGAHKQTSVLEIAVLLPMLSSRFFPSSLPVPSCSTLRKARHGLRAFPLEDPPHTYFLKLLIFSLRIQKRYWFYAWFWGALYLGWTTPLTETLLGKLPSGALLKINDGLFTI